MSSFYDQFPCCFRHPQQRVVGVCSSCLQERLFLLIESTISDPRSDDAGRSYSSLPMHKITVIHRDQERSLPPFNDSHGNAQDRPASSGSPPPTHEQLPTMRTHLAKHGDRCSSPDAMDLLVRSSTHVHGGAIGRTGLSKSATPPESNVGLHDCRQKKTGSWFSFPKLPYSSTNVNNKKLSWNHGTSSSWISSFFPSRKCPVPAAKSNMSSVSTEARADTVGEAALPRGAHRRSPKNSINDTGRHSWNPTRPNFKHLLKRIEGRSKRRRADGPPSNYTDTDSNHNGQSLQKSNTVMSSKASICVEMHNEQMQASASPMMLQDGHGNVTVGIEYERFVDRASLTRSRSWSRTWNRVLSPLRSYHHKSAYDSPYQYNHYQVGSFTPSHGSSKEPSVCAPTPCSSHLSLSPLRMSGLAPVSRIGFAN